MGLFDGLFGKKGRNKDQPSAEDLKNYSAEDLANTMNYRIDEFYRGASGAKRRDEWVKEKAGEFKAGCEVNWLDPKYFKDGHIEMSNILRHLGASAKLAENKTVQNEILRFLVKSREDIEIPDKIEDKINLVVKKISDIITISESEVKFMDGKRLKLFEVNNKGELTEESVTKGVKSSQDTYHTIRRYNKEGLLMCDETKWEEIDLVSDKLKTLAHFASVRDDVNPFIVHQYDYKKNGANGGPEEKIFITDEKGVLNLETDRNRCVEGDISKIRNDASETMQDTLNKIKASGDKQYKSLLDTMKTRGDKSLSIEL